MPEGWAAGNMAGAEVVRRLAVGSPDAERHEALRPVALLREDALGHERVKCGFMFNADPQR